MKQALLGSGMQAPTLLLMQKQGFMARYRNTRKEKGSYKNRPKRNRAKGGVATMKHGDYMRLALQEAALAAATGDVPVGAVIVKNGSVLARAHNQKEALRDPTAHAEILAIREAAKLLGNWRLSGCTLYVTLEPCPMCAGAVVAARLDKLVYAASDSLWGACGSVFHVPAHTNSNHTTEVIGGILEEEAAVLLKNWFASKRG